MSARRMGTVLAALVLLLALQGCASWPADVKLEEGLYIGAQALDDWQTAHYKDYRNDRELVSDAIIGHKPSPRSCLLFGVASEAAHFALTDALIDSGHPDLARFWELGSTGFEIGVEAKSFWITRRVLLGNHQGVP